MFENLTDRMQGAFRNLTGRGKLTESNISESMREVRRALLEADVNYKVAKKFVDRVTEECLGEKVLKSIAPGQQAVKVVNDQLTALLGEANAPLNLDDSPSVIILCGLHGAGKTTTASKLAKLLKDKHAKKPLLVAADVHRPAAIHQLQVLGDDLGIPVYAEEDNKDVAEIAANGKRYGVSNANDVIIIDTAGRLQIDEVLVQELVKVKKSTDPGEILLVADSALGQEAVSVAEHFDGAMGITGIILTKLDGDARGGAAISMREVTGRPIKFIGVGELPQDLEPFHPERLASRILGMGDVVSLVERAADQFEEEEAQRLEEKLRKGTFDYEMFLDQLSKIRKMGGLLSLLDMMPGMSGMKGMNVDENKFNRIESIIHSMTKQERCSPDLLSNISRKRRIAKGSGVEVVEVNQVVKQFEMMRKMMSKVGKMGGKLPGMGKLGGLGGMDEMEEMMNEAGGMGGLGGGGGLPGFGGGMSGLGKRGSRSQKPKAKKRKKKSKKRKK